nr:hypothetical membrane protein, mscS family [uncultured archaeon]
MLQPNIMAIPTGTLNTLITLIKISIAIIATVIVARLINRVFVIYFKFASEKLKVDETTYTVVRRIIIVTIYVIGGVVVISLIPGLPDLVLGLAAGAGIAAIVICFAAQRALSNVFSGISIAIFRPFRVGDIVEMENEYGTIEDITLRHTVIRTWHEKAPFGCKTIVARAKHWMVQSANLQPKTSFSVGGPFSYKTSVIFLPQFGHFDRERDISSKTEENYEEICSGSEDVRVHQLDILLEGYNN